MATIIEPILNYGYQNNIEKLHWMTKTFIKKKIVFDTSSLFISNRTNMTSMTNN